VKLDPRICKRCVSSEHEWTEWDDMAVADGKVFCPPEKALWRLDQKPPDTCKYLLEMVVEEQ
jgi:hypothetical protein